MPNFPSIHDELLALWRYLQNFQSVTVNQEARLQDIETRLTCVSYTTSPTNSTVFNCDVRLSGSGMPDLYVDGNITTNNNLTVSGSTVLGDNSSDTVKINARDTDNTITNILGLNGAGILKTRTLASILSAGATVQTTGSIQGDGSSANKIRLTDNVTVNQNLTVSGSTILGTDSSDIVTLNAVTNASTTTNHKVITIDESTGIVKKQTFANAVTAGGGLTNINNYYGDWSRSLNIPQYGSETTLIEQRYFSYTMTAVIPGTQPPGFLSRSTQSAVFKRIGNHVQGFITIKTGVNSSGSIDLFNFDSAAWDGSTANTVSGLPYLDGGYNGNYNSGVDPLSGQALGGSVFVLGISGSVNTTLTREHGIIYDNTIKLPNLGGWKDRVTLSFEYFFDFDTWEYYYNRQ